MRALNLEFRHKPSWALRLGWIALAVIVPVLGVLGWHSWQTMGEIEARQAELESLHARLSPPRIDRNTAEGQRLGTEMKAADDVLRQLGQPWGGLFSAVAEAAVDQVALLGIDPDPEKGEVRLTGEARRYEDVLEYSRRLEGTAPLDGVHLQSHQVQAQDRERPVRFTLDARWRNGA